MKLPRFPAAHPLASAKLTRRTAIACLAGILIVSLAMGCRPQEQATPQLESNRQMAERLQLLAEGSRPQHHVYLNELRADRFAAQGLPADPEARAAAILSTAREELRAGRSASAINRLERELARDSPGEAWRRRSRSPWGLLDPLRFFHNLG